MTQRFKRMCQIYKIFAEPWECDLSKEAMQEMFEFESKGIGNIDISGFNTTGEKPNGYAVGKKWLNVQVKAWLKDCELFIDGVEQEHYRGWLNVLKEIYADPKFPHWWLDEVFSNFIAHKKLLYGDKFDGNYKINNREEERLNLASHGGCAI